MKGGAAAVFLGTHQPRLDEKGRLFLPAKFREELADGLVIAKGQERCLYIWTVPEFLRVTEALRAAHATRSFERVLFASASQEKPDKQGRITVPPALREYAGLDRDCVVIGAGVRVEVWDRAAWESFLAETEPAFAETPDGVMPGVL